MKCLVTGGCGFVGSALVRRLLSENYEIVIVDDLSKGSPENLRPNHHKVTLITGDVSAGMDSILLQFQPEIVFHLAAMHFIPDCDADPLGCLRINAEGTRVVLSAAAALDRPAAVILASSAAVYAPGNEAHQEEDALGPLDVYGYSKRWAEELISNYADRTHAGVGIARLFNVFGPGETNPHLIPTIISQLQAGETLRLGNLSSKRDYVFVDDVADALARMGSHCHSGESLTMNVGSGRTYTGTEVVDTLLRLSTRQAKPPITVDPGRVRTVDRPILQANYDLARKVLNWVPATSLQAGLQASWRSPVGAGVVL
jgi:UDP-glucose 4-epimerase